MASVPSVEGWSGSTKSSLNPSGDAVHVDMYVSMMYFTPVTSGYFAQTGFHRLLRTFFHRLDCVWTVGRLRQWDCTTQARLCMDCWLRQLDCTTQARLCMDCWLRQWDCTTQARLCMDCWLRQWDCTTQARLCMDCWLRQWECTTQARLCMDCWLRQWECTT